MYVMINSLLKVLRIIYRGCRQRHLDVDFLNNDDSYYQFQGFGGWMGSLAQIGLHTICLGCVEIIYYCSKAADLNDKITTPVMLKAQKGFLHHVAFKELFSGAFLNDFSGLQDISVIGDAQGFADVLLHQ